MQGDTRVYGTAAETSDAVQVTPVAGLAAGEPSALGVRTWRLLLVLAVGSVAVRAAAATLRGDYLGFDESMYILLGRNLLAGHGYTLNDLPNATFPFLISLIAALGDLAWGPRYALSLPSALLGGAAVVPLYLVAKRLASRKVALAAAVLYVGFPSLLHFSPYVSYARRLYEGSEQIYLFLFLFASYFALRAVQESRWRDYIMAGAFTGAAFQVRQDAALFAAAVLAWMLGAAVLRRRGRDVARAAGFAAAVLLLAAPFLAHTWRVTGEPGAGPRFAKTFLMRDTFAPVIESNDWRAALNSYFTLSEDGRHLETAYFGVSPWHRENAAEGGRGAGVMDVLRGLRAAHLAGAWKAFSRWVLPDRLGILVALGLLAMLMGPGRRMGMSFCLALIFPAAFTAMALFPLARFSMYLAPLLVIFIAWGIVFALELAARMAPRVSRWVPAAGVVAAAALSAYGGHTSIASQMRYAEDRRNYEMAFADLSLTTADWLRRNTDPDARVMASAPQAAVLAGRQWLALPMAEGERVAAHALLRRAHVIVESITTPAPPPRAGRRARATRDGAVARPRLSESENGSDPGEGAPRNGRSVSPARGDQGALRGEGPEPGVDEDAAPRAPAARRASLGYRPPQALRHALVTVFSRPAHNMRVSFYVFDLRVDDLPEVLESQAHDLDDWNALTGWTEVQ